MARRTRVSAIRPVGRLAGLPPVDADRAPMTRSEWLILVAAMLVGGGMLLLGLGAHPFWDDEAITAYFGRAILRTGAPTALYGENLNSVRNGLELFPNLRDRAFPQVNFYVTAVGMWLFGESTLAARLPHAFLGWLTIPALFWATDRWFRDRRLALAAACVLAVWVPFLLYARNCRYYAMSMLLGTVLWGMLPGLSVRRWRGLAAFSLLLLASFHNHYYMAVALGFSLGGLALVTRQWHTLRALGICGAVVGIVNVPWLLWIKANQHPDVSGYAFPNAKLELLLPLVSRFFFGMNRFVLVQFFVLVIGIPVLAVWWRQDRRRAKRFLALIPFVTIFVVVTALLFPIPGKTTVSHQRFLDVRYLVSIVPILCMAMAVIATQLFRLVRPVGAVVFALLIGTDLLCGISPNRVHRDYDRRSSLAVSEVNRAIPWLRCRSFLADYLIEYTSTPKSLYGEVLKFLEDRSRPGDTIFTEPRYHSQVVLYYMGDRLRVVGMLEPDNQHILGPNRDRIPRHAYQINEAPKWILQMAPEIYHPGVRARMERPGVVYREHALPIDRRASVRPELRWRAFRLSPAESEDKRVRILERVDAN